MARILSFPPRDGKLPEGRPAESPLMRVSLTDPHVTLLCPRCQRALVALRPRDLQPRVVLDLTCGVHACGGKLTALFVHDDLHVLALPPAAS